MLPPAVVEQQAKLGVSVEESKAQRLKRQQARFRDRGGAFVPSTSNPLVDILLARNVSGESPSKLRPKNVAAKRTSLSKARQASPTHKASAATATEETRVVVGSSKSRPASRKGKAKIVELEVDPDPKPAPKRRGRPAQSKKKAQDPDPDTEQPSHSNTKSKPTSKRSGRQRAAPTSSDQRLKMKPKPKANANAANEVVEVLDTDDDQTLVEVPHKVKSKPKRNIPYEDDGETDDDAPIIRKRAVPRVDDSKASGTKTATRVKTEKIADTLGKQALEDGEETTQDEKRPMLIAKKRPVSRDEEAVAAPPAKKGRAANLMSAKSKAATEPEPAPCPTRNFKNEDNLKATGKEKGKGRAEPVQDVVESLESGNDERRLERVSKHKKRKKEGDNYDAPPRKAVKFSETGPSYSSSYKLRENQADRKRERTANSNVKDKPDARLATKAPSIPKGPPREVLERIKASAARHLRGVDGEPDELDCLS